MAYNLPLNQNNSVKVMLSNTAITKFVNYNENSVRSTVAHRSETS